MGKKKPFLFVKDVYGGLANRRELCEIKEKHQTYYLRDENGRVFTDLFEVHIIELGKTLNGNSTVDDWIRFFNARSEEELDMIHTQNVGINTAIEEVKKMSLSEHMRTRYEAHMKEIRDRNAREDYVRQEGRILEVYDSVQEGDYGLKRGAEKLGISVEELKKQMEEAGYRIP